MALYRPASDAFIDRAGIPGLFLRGDDQQRFRRGRRLGRVGKGGRLSGWVSFLVVFMLLYTSFLGWRFWFHQSGSDSDSMEMVDSTEDKPEMKLDPDENAASGSVKDEESLDSHELSNTGSQGRNFSDRLPGEEGQKIFEEENPVHPKVKHHKQKYFPCEISFANSTENLVEPKDFLKFNQFSLEYIEQEEMPYGSEPRFGGHQSLEERENTFYARDQRLHCGFVKGPKGTPSTGFDLSVNDQEYIKSCHIVVSSCIFGNSDFLRRPASKKISARSKESVCFVMFVDEITMEKLSSEGKILDEGGYVGLWKMVLVKNLPYNDMRRTGKIPKFLTHRLFPTSRYSIWIDSKLRLITDPILIIEHFLWQKGAEYAISNHYDRHCVWEEVLQNKRLNKYNHSAIDDQFHFYQQDGLLRFNSSNEKNVLPSNVPEGSFIVRAHTPMSNLFSCLWFNEVDRFTSRDQLSFAYTFLKMRRMNPHKLFHLDMFRDCERRAMTKLFHHRADP